MVIHSYVLELKQKDWEFKISLVLLTESILKHKTRHSGTSL